MLRAVVWMVLRGDAATATTFASEIETYEQGRCGTLRSGASRWRPTIRPPPRTCSAGPGTGGRASASEEQRDHRTYDRDPLVRPAERGGHRRVVRAGRAAADPSSPLYAVAMSYLLHGLGYAGRREDAIRGRGGRRGPAGGPDPPLDEPALRPRADAPRRRRHRCGENGFHLGGDGRIRTGHDEHRRILLGLSRAHRMDGRATGTTPWCTPSARCRSTSSPTSASCTRPITGIAVLVPAARGDWDVADRTSGR